MIFLFNYVYACVIEYGHPPKPKGGFHQIPWSWICTLVSGVQPGSWELNSRPLQEQQVLLNAALFLQPPTLVFACLFYVLLFVFICFKQNLTLQPKLA